ncbi:hypothetical protein SAMN05216421_1079 [Halopseudomonas xinjiangensis]|uniref:Uncharacterized protein n=1 Tax=Halopseudomonas xinjiangensis TaxID=487184 RepID=A0A1H1Q836_9GAMM|nr:hypothetical protein [Halopseudomonas xinjiangensis]SDS19606.1 hypothetical protein SAMN05216421_1079 [Halopseudomonas xinjiangensis]
MFSDYWIGQPGVPVIAREARPEHIRSVIEPTTPREEYLVARIEELAAKATGAEVLGKYFDEDDDDDEIYQKIDLKRRAEYAERQADEARRKMLAITEAVRSFTLAQSVVASQEQRLQMMLDGIKQLSDQIRG